MQNERDTHEICASAPGLACDFQRLVARLARRADATVADRLVGLLAQYIARWMTRRA